MWIGDVPDRTRTGILHIRSFQIESGAVKRIEELGGAAMGWRRRRLNPGNRRGTESFGGARRKRSMDPMAEEMEAKTSSGRGIV